MRMRIIRNNAEGFKGHPQTKQRELLLKIMRNTNRHVDAKELFKLAVKEDNSISPATVYRSLKLFKELELVNEQRLGQARCYYEIKHSREHQHLVCSKCGKVVDFDCPLKAMIKKVKDEKGFVVTRAEVFLEGYCSECGSGEEVKDGC